VTALFEGAQRHFEESQKRSVPALGGRATKTPGIRSTARVLKGFGGCGSLIEVIVTALILANGTLSTGAGRPVGSG
jgi:hypothetical protein